MKKTADKHVRSVVSVLLSVVFFFSSSAFFGVCSISASFSGRYTDGDFEKSIVNALFDEMTETLTDTFREYYLSPDGIVSCPSEFSEDKSNFFFVAKASSGKEIIKNYYTDDFSYHETKTVTVGFPAKNGDSVNADTVTVECYLRSELLAKDVFYRSFKLISLQEYIGFFYIASFSFLALSIWLFCKNISAFFRFGKRRVLLRHLEPVPADIFFLSLLPAMVFLFQRLTESFQSRAETITQYAYSGVGKSQILLFPVYSAALFFLVFASLIVIFYTLGLHGKRGIFSFVRYKMQPFTRMGILYFMVIQAVKALAIGLYFSSYTNLVLLLLLAEKLVTLPILFKSFKELRVIMEKTAKFADGDLSDSFDTKGYFKTFSDHAADIACVTERISISADEYIRSSKFKAELITNLSHDIKTPLTSILSYSQLLQKDDLSDDERKQFLSVLGRHSVRLQKLIEDLMEVSDAASGNIKANPVSIDLCDILPQVVIGFDERLSKRNITVKQTYPDTPVIITADSRLLWRVADNLMNNICKYAMENTEAELSVLQSEKDVRIVVSNTSSHKIEISGDELTERFTRADSSRHTEGSGLGLSIAKSLMNLMNGTLRITTDGNIFTAEVIFFSSSEQQTVKEIL